MAATLKLRRGNPTGSLQVSELFYDTNIETVVVGDGGGSNTQYKILGKLDESNSGSFYVLGNITGSSISASGDITADNITALGDLTIGGNLFLGDNIADNIVISAELSSSLIPNDDSAFDLGSQTKKWKNIYADSASIDNITFNGSGIVSSSQQIDDLGFLKVLGDSVVSGSEQIVDVLTSVNSYTASNDTTNTTQDTRLDQLSTETGSISTEQATQDSRLSSLETETGSIDTAQTAQDNRLDSIEAATGSYLSSTGSVDYDDITNKPTLVSGSSQITYGDISSLPTNIVSSSTDSSEINFTITNGNISAELIGGVVSGSSQITITESQISDLSHTDISSLNSYTSSNDTIIGGINSATASLESRIDLLSSVSHSHSNKANLDTINQDLSTTSDVTFNTGSFTGNMTITGDLTVLGSSTEISSTELRIEDKLITVASGSADSAAADGAGLEIDGAGKSLTWDHNTSQFVLDAKVSSSVGFKGEGGELTGIDTDQVTEATNKYYTDARVKTKLDADDIHSGSYLGTATTSNLDEGSNLYYTETRISSSLNNRGIISGSSQVLDILSSLNSYTSSNDNTITNIESTTSSFEDRLDSIESATGSYLTSSGSVDYDDITNKPTLVSGSSQVDFTELDNLPGGLVSGSTFQSNHQGAFTSSVNGTDTNIDLGLEEGDSPTFSGLSLTNLSYVGAGNQTALISGSGGTINVRTLGTSAFFNVSASIADDPNSVPTTKAVNDALISAGAGDITEVNPTSTFNPNTTGLVHLSSGTEVGGVKGVQGNIHIAIDTGSNHFTDGVSAIASIPDGTISGSDQLTGSFEQLGSGIFSGSSQVNGTQITNNEITIVSTAVALGDSISLSQITNGSSIVSGSSQLTSSFEQVGNGIISGALQLASTSVSNESLNSYTSSNDTDISSIESRLDNIESNTGSYDDQTNITSLNAYTASNDTTNSTQNSRLDQLSTETGSISSEQTAQDSRLSNLEASTGSYLTTVDISSDTNLAVSDTSQVDMILTGDTLSANLKGGVVSGSSQLTLGGDVTGTANANTVGKVQGVSLTSGEASQIANIDSVTISNTQWGYLGASNQGISTSDNVQFADVIISGNLTVQGTQTTLNTTNLEIEDKLLSVASGSLNHAQADGAGFHISGADASMTWDNGNDRLFFNTGSFFSGSVQASGDIVAYASSDERLKHEITPIQNALQKINQISGNSFIWDEEKQNIYKGKDYGVVAQEIEEILPELVQTREDGYKAVKYEKLVSLLIEGVKELSQELTKLKKEIGK